MALKKYCIIALLAIMAMLLPMASPVAASPGAITLTTDQMEYGGYTRTWGYWVPTGYTGSEPVPLVFSFHGLGSSGQGQETLTSFAELAEEEGFIVVFPDSTDIPGVHPALPLLPGNTIQWNVGSPISMQYQYDVDDVGFIAELVDKFKEDYNIDASRVYATGMSDGAFLTCWLAMNLPGTFAGFAPVCGQMGVNDLLLYNFDQDVGCPATIILINGTADPIVLYDGDGALLGSVNQTIDYWRDADNTTTGPVETVFDGYPGDPTIITRYVYGGGTNGTEVILYKVDGGGHTWPGSYQYADESFIGKTSYECNATEQIWEHFEAYALPPLPPIRQSPKMVTKGEEFEVTIHFAAPADNFTDITLTDTAPAGWDVSVDTTWTDPEADTATPTSNEAEYTWNGPYDEGTAFTAVYKVTVPGAAAAGNYTFTGSLDYSIDGEPDEVAIAGNTRVEVVEEYTLTINCGTGGSVTMPSTGTFTYRAGKVVYLKARPDTGCTFNKWSGDDTTIDDTNAAGTVITMGGNYTITAEFTQPTPPSPTPGEGCFIATAAYGTSTAEQLDVLREFRDDVLLKSTLGSRLVDLYYKVSPPIADFISEHSFVKTLVRELLIDPIVWVVEATEGIWQN